MKDYSKQLKQYERNNPTLSEQVDALEIARRQKRFLKKQLADGFTLVTQYTLNAVGIVATTALIILILVVF